MKVASACAKKCRLHPSPFEWHLPCRNCESSHVPASRSAAQPTSREDAPRGDLGANARRSEVQDQPISGAPVDGAAPRRSPGVPLRARPLST